QGFKDELPAATVTLDRFFLYRCEVTNAQFARFLEARGRAADEAGRPLLAEHPWGLRRIGDRWEPADGLENRPALGVSWYGAFEYARWAGGSLPTEAQWEKAASWEPDGPKRLFPWGNAYRHGTAVCADLFGGEEFRSELQLDQFLQKGLDALRVLTQPADSLPEGASPRGCLHMAGNVWEWCLDSYDKEFYASQESRFPNPCRTRGGTERTLRGGGWKSMARDCRTTNRTGADPAQCPSDVGLRVARAG
ncbi:MAG: formylglycine-generating enzyme family protein, partial [Planctomycetes bacterium]|nr:formylglycine-generating enzyme family protein [Planctomycetota bacterium]